MTGGLLELCKSLFINFNLALCKYNRIWPLLTL